MSTPWQAYMVAPLAVEEASNTQLQSWPFQNVTVQCGKQHTMNSFIVDGVFRWAAGVWKEVLPFHHWVIRTMEA